MWCNTHKLICILHDAIGREATGSCQALLENFMLSYLNFLLAHLKWTGKRGPVDMLDNRPDIAPKAGVGGIRDTNKTTISTYRTISTTMTCHTQHGRPCLHDQPHMLIPGRQARETTLIRKILLHVGPISMLTNTHLPTERPYQNRRSRSSRRLLRRLPLRHSVRQ